MTQQFNDNVFVDGVQDIQQLRVQGHVTQANPLQTWENSAGTIQAQVTGDGRVEIGDYNLSTGDPNAPESLLEIHRAETSTSKPKRGLHSLGQLKDALTSVVYWMVCELELRGSNAISAVHTAFRIRASNFNTGTGAITGELLGGDIEVINESTAGANALPNATGLQVAVNNAAGKTIANATGLRVNMAKGSGTITNPFSIYTQGPGPFHLEDYMELKRPAVVPGTPTDTDFVRVYPKSDGKLYAKNWSGVEFDLTAGGGTVIDNPGINNIRLSMSSTDPNPAPGANGTTIYVHPFAGEQISLYDTASGKFIPRSVTSPIALDMTAVGALGGNQVPFMPQDIFLYWDTSSGTIKAVVVPWAAAPIAKAVTNITNASPPVLTVGASHGFVVDDLVVLQGVTGGAAGLNNAMYRVIATTATTVSLGQLDATNVAAPGGTSTNGTLYKITNQVTRTTALGTLRGVKIKASDANNPKYIGTVAYGEAKDTIYDTLNRPFIWNLYNQVDREVTDQDANDTTVSWTCNTTTNTPTNSRAAGNRYQERFWFLIGLGAFSPKLTYRVTPVAPLVASLNSAYTAYLSLNAIAQYANANASFSRTKMTVQLSSAASGMDLYLTDKDVGFDNSIAPGLHYVQFMESVFGSGSNNWTMYRNYFSSPPQVGHKGGFTGRYPR
ncbi:MAG: hypothetical protein R3E39_32160 [Anaerolineae bacterium]